MTQERKKEMPYIQSYKEKLLNQSSWNTNLDTLVLLSNCMKHTLKKSEKRQGKHFLDSLLIFKLRPSS